VEKPAAERGISHAHFVATVVRPDTKRKQRLGDRGGTVYLFIKKVGGRELHVSAEL
jgi:hypothetical protein